MDLHCPRCSARLTEEQQATCPRSFGVGQALLGLVVPGLGVASLGALRLGLAWFAGTIAAACLSTSLFVAVHGLGALYTFLFARTHGRCPHCGEWLRFPTGPTGGDPERVRVATLSVVTLVGTWALAASPVVLYVLGGALMGRRREDMEALLIALCGGVPVVLLGTYLQLSWASPEERARREVYAEFAGWAVDVGRLRGRRRPLRGKVLQRLAEEAQALPSPGYRETYAVEREWERLALDPLVERVPLLRAALTLARLEISLAPRKERARLRKIEAGIWARLKALDPAVSALTV